MSEQVKKLVPKLRFPEFEAAGGWERKPLGEVATFYNGRAYKQEELLEEGKYRVLRVGNFFTNNNWYFSDLELEDDKYCENGDLLYAWSASFGPRIWKGEKVIYHYHIWKVVEKPLIHKSFLFTILNFETEKLKSQSANGLGLMHITKGAIESWQFSLPKLEEQQKIADCLSSLDDLITAQNQKVEALKQHKKGLMQQLFPAEGETVPKLRFPEFEHEVEWQFIPLNKIAKRCINKNRNEQITRVLTNSAEFGVVDQRDFFDKDIATQGNLDGYYIVEEGDYVYNPRISSFAPVGPISKNKIGLGVMSPLYAVFRFDEEHNDFYSLFFKSSGWHLYMRQVSSTGARHDRMAISNEAFMKMPVPMTSDQEQQKIADFLTYLDELIAFQAQQLEAYKAHKKGLIQQLFPSLDEV